MVICEENILQFVRGDDVFLLITVIQPDNSEYVMQEGDYLTLTIKKNADDPNNQIIAQVSSTSESPQVITIPHNTTKSIVSGRYFYDVKLYQQSLGRNRIFTVIPASIALVEETTHYPT